MRSQSPGQSSTGILLILVVLALVVVLSAVATWHQAASPWLYSDTDHQNLAPMYYKLSNPALFSRDYIFQDDRYFRFYTPSFLGLLQVTAAASGDYFHGVALLQAPFLAAYLVAAYALFWQVSHSQTIALIFSLLSIVGVSVIIDFWRVNGLASMLPRTASLSVIVLAALLLVRYIGPIPGEHGFNGQAWWHWLILGVVVGIAANFHPTTGICLALTTGLVALAARRRTQTPTMLHLLMLVTGTFIAAIPIVQTVAGGSNPGLTSAEFERFASAFQARIAMPPFSGSRLEVFGQDGLYVLGVVWLALTLISWFLARSNRRSWAALLFVGVQLVYVWLMVKNDDVYLDGLMVIVVGAFFAWRWWAKDEQGEMLFYEMIAAIVGVSFVMPLVLRVVWLELEVGSLTTIVAELPRGARLLTLPLYLVGARLALHLAQEPMRRGTLWLIYMAFLSILVPVSMWHGVLVLLFIFGARLERYSALYAGAVSAVSTYMIYQIVTRADANQVAVVVGAYVTLAVYGLSRMGVVGRARTLYMLLGAGIGVIVLTAFNVIEPLNFLNDSPWYVFALRGSPDFMTFVLGSTAGLGMWVLFRDSSTPPPGSVHGEGERTSTFEEGTYLNDEKRDLHKPNGESLSNRSPAGVRKLADRLGQVNLLTWLGMCLIGVMAIQTVGMMRLSMRPVDAPGRVEAAQWAQANTPQDALFFDTAGDGSAFRLWSQRSVTHGWKELGLVGYARPAELADMMERYQRIMVASVEPDDVLAMADELDADYIIRDADAPLDLPEAYRNDDVIIYEVAR